MEEVMGGGWDGGKGGGASVWELVPSSQHLPYRISQDGECKYRGLLQ